MLAREAESGSLGSQTSPGSAFAKLGPPNDQEVRIDGARLHHHHHHRRTLAIEVPKSRPQTGMSPKAAARLGTHTLETRLKLTCSA